MSEPEADWACVPESGPVSSADDIAHRPIQAELRYSDPPFPWYLRATLAVIGLGVVGLLATARSLTPSEEGFGTHQQLGLPQCTFKTLYNGMPCPSCGMTTSWAHLTRGQLVRSFQANPGGMLLGMVCMSLGPWFLASAIFARWWPGVPSEKTMIGIAGAVCLTTLVNWLIRILA